MSNPDISISELKERFAQAEANLQRIAQQSRDVLTNDAKQVDMQKLQQSIDTFRTDMVQLRNELNGATAHEVPTFEKTTVATHPARRTLELNRRQRDGWTLVDEKKHDEDSMTLTFQRPIEKTLTADQIKTVHKDHRWMSPADQHALMRQMERGE